MTQLQKLAKQAHCHPSTIRALLKAGKIVGEKRPGRTHHKPTWHVTTPAAEVVALVRQTAPRSGYRKNGGIPRVSAPDRRREQTFLESALAWREIPAAKRPILLQLAVRSEKELALLLDLVAE